MTPSYRTPDLADQNTESVTHRVVMENGMESMLTRLGLSPEILANLFGVGVFEQALVRLKSLKYEGLRKVTDGGMDESDGAPWVMSPWVEGKPLSEQRLEEKDIRGIGEQCQRLMEEMGDLASAVSFDPTQIQTIRTPDRVLHALFTIDYFRWFRDAAAGSSPGAGCNEAGEVRRLLEKLVVQQLKLPKKKREEAPIPFVEDRSPALTAYQGPRSRCLVSAFLWLGFFLMVGVVAWLTWVGMERLKENPQKEIPARNG